MYLNINFNKENFTTWY